VVRRADRDQKRYLARVSAENRRGRNGARSIPGVLKDSKSSDAAFETVHGGFGRQILPFISQPRHQLFGREMAVRCARQEGEHLSFLARAQRIARTMSRPTPAIVGIGVAFPALDRSRRKADHLTCGAESCRGNLASFRAARITARASRRCRRPRPPPGLGVFLSTSNAAPSASALFFPRELALKRADPLHRDQRR
jgi:hypothetical protein